jgi:hypothetical protein
MPRTTLLGCFFSGFLSKVRSCGDMLMEETQLLTKIKDIDQHAKWEVKDAQVMAWIFGSVEPNIILNLRSSQTAAQIWTYLKKFYSQ